MFDVSAYSAVLLAHIIAGIVLIGSSMFAPHTRRAIVAAPSVGALLAWLDFGRRSARANPPAAMVLLLTGLYLGSRGWWSQGWFFVALGAWVVNVLLALLVVQRTAGSLARAAASAGDGPIGPDLDAMRRSAAWDVAEAAMRANDLGMLYVMLLKPSLVESCLVVGTLCVGSVAVGMARRGRETAPTIAAGSPSSAPSQVCSA